MCLSMSVETVDKHAQVAATLEGFAPGVVYREQFPYRTDRSALYRSVDDEWFIRINPDGSARFINPRREHGFEQPHLCGIWNASHFADGPLSRDDDTRKLDREPSIEKAKLGQLYRDAAGAMWRGSTKDRLYRATAAGVRYPGAQAMERTLVDFAYGPLTVVEP